MRHILIGVCIGVLLIAAVFLGVTQIPDYNRAECIYYASQVWCKL